MTIHASHAWTGISGWCAGCGCYALAVEAEYQCRPTDDARPCDTEPATEVDWSEITRLGAT